MAKKMVQVHLEDEVLAALDRRARTEGRSRAEVIRAACRSYLATQEREPSTAPRRGALALLGAWGNVSDAEIDALVAGLYVERARDSGRPVDLEP